MALSPEEVIRGERIDRLAAHLSKKPQYATVKAGLIWDIAAQIIDSEEARKNSDPSALRRAFG